MSFDSAYSTETTTICLLYNSLVFDLSLFLLFILCVLEIFYLLSFQIASFSIFVIHQNMNNFLMNKCKFIYKLTRIELTSVKDLTVNTNSYTIPNGSAPNLSNDNDFGFFSAKLRADD